MEAKRKTIWVLMFPWLAHGHTSPLFLELAKSLADRNFHIYMCSTPINLKYSIKKSVLEKYSQSIELVELHLPSLPNLPPHYPTTNGLPSHLMGTLKEFEMAAPKFSEILLTLNPDLVIYDYNQPWAADFASSLNNLVVVFIIFSVAAIPWAVHVFGNTEEKFPFPEIYLHEYEMLSLKKDIDETPVPLGSLVQQSIDQDDHEEIKQWLDKKEKSSTIFVSFGSEYFLSKEEIHEVAKALELSKVNFIWVLRFPHCEKISMQDALPEGYLERVGGRGMVMEGWASQAKVLQHPSIRGFVSHCGWSSFMESMKFGVPIIAMPMHLDQPLNARLVEYTGVGVEAARDKDGKLQSEEIAKAIRKVVVEERPL
ncbi:putative cyanidin-3-O-glucoside 2-O-glucuronosyltransferase-like [Capsicum annuum]|nr:putative cyanidin-3-O-glucoside 2-O-glucuronosyltransferase-like [Capsicum annuum]KAF3613315.1 putative cyanidin-3-O-glucoside 2-O-glucuronosyltransferase-like [Capsicum annuum]